MSDLPVISGIGHVGPTGRGTQALCDDLAKSRLRLTEVDKSGGYHRPRSARWALQVGKVDLSSWVPARVARRMSPPSLWCLAAAKMALKEARWRDGAALGDRGGAIIGTAFGTTSFTESLLKQIFLQGPQQASPFRFAETVANAPTAQVAIGTGATGTNETVTQREVGDLLAIGRASAEILRGRCDRVLAGAYDEIHPLIHAYLDRFRALASETEEGKPLPRPFDRGRSGFVTGEGATVALVESEEAARSRGAASLVRIRGNGAAFDPTAPGHGWGHGVEALARGLQRTLERAGVSLDDIDLIVSGASGSLRGDRIEAGILRSLGERLPPVVAPRAITGIFGGGFLAAAVSIAAGSPVGPPMGFRQMDPDLGVRPHDGSPLAPPNLTLVSTPAAGGAAAWLLLERP